MESRLQGEIINNLRYADDTILMAQSKELKRLLMKATPLSEKQRHLISAHKVFVKVSPGAGNKSGGASDVSPVMLAFFLNKELRDQSWQIEQCPEGVRKRF